MNAKTKRALHELLWLPIFALATVILLALLIRIVGQDPRIALIEFWRGSFGSYAGLAATASRALILILYGLGIAISFRAGILNIGAEGQSRVGAAFGTALGVGAAGAALASAPLLGMLVILVAGAAAGALWSLIAGILRRWRAVPEVISTLMLNYIALQLVQFLVSKSILKAESGFDASDLLPANLRLGHWGGTEFHSGIFLAIPVLLLCHVFLFWTKSGFHLRAIGLNPIAARACGVAVDKISLVTFALSGALAGVGGAMGVLALWRLMGTVPTYPDYGFMAIAVALVANLRPLQVLPSAILFAGMEVGAKAMERSAGVSNEVVYLVEGAIILAILVRGVEVFKKSGIETVVSSASSEVPSNASTVPQSAGSPR